MRCCEAPPLVAHVLVALSTDRQLVIAAGHKLIDMYTKYPFYAKMFMRAGLPLIADGNVPDTLVQSLVISGNEATVTVRFSELLASGLDELMVTLLPVIDAGDEHARLLHLIGEL